MRQVPGPTEGIMMTKSESAETQQNEPASRSQSCTVKDTRRRSQILHRSEALFAEKRTLQATAPRLKTRKKYDEEV